MKKSNKYEAICRVYQYIENRIDDLERELETYAEEEEKSDWTISHMKDLKDEIEAYGKLEVSLK